MEGLTIHQAIVRCWTAMVIPRLQLIFQALPAVIIWELWKRKNSFKHGEVVTISSHLSSVNFLTIDCENKETYNAECTSQMACLIAKPGIIHSTFEGNQGDLGVPYLGVDQSKYKWGIEG